MRWTMLLFGLVLASCGGPAPTTSSGPVSELAGRIAGAPQSCAPNSPNENLRVIDSSTVAVGSGSTIYINHLGAPCPGLAPLSTLIIDVQTGRYCRGDRFRALEPEAIIPGPTCILGDWIPYRTRS
jgi:hypothetical protein